MLISKALGTYNKKDATIYLTEVALLLENTSAAPQFQFRVAFPLNNISKVAARNNTLFVTLKNGEMLKLVFLRKSKLEIFYKYLLTPHTNVMYDDTECIFCGTPLEGKYCTKCGQMRVEIMNDDIIEEPQTHTCWSCGAEFETKVAFCSECGAKQDVNKLLVRIGAEINKKQVYNVCPRCGSHNIKIYRRGYNYKVGFWGAIFGVKGAGYAGGFGANTACCRCMDCGKDWETDYDYRLIDK